MAEVSVWCDPALGVRMGGMERGWQVLAPAYVDTCLEPQALVWSPPATFRPFMHVHCMHALTFVDLLNAPTNPKLAGGQAQRGHRTFPGHPP